MLTRTNVFCALLMSAIVTSEGSAWQFSGISSSTNVFVDGVSETAQDRFEAFSQCANQSVERGEFETKEEFEARERNLYTGCGSLRRVKSYLESKVNLEYNADEFYFTFHLVSGNLSVPNARFSSGSILIPYDFFDKSCLPREIGPIVYTMRAASHVMNRRDGITRQYDCPAIKLDFQRGFFSGGKASLPLNVLYYTQNCDCTSRNLLGRYCKRAECSAEIASHDIGDNAVYTRTKFSLILRAPIEAARALKAAEDSLRLRLEGEFRPWNSKRGYFFKMQRVLLVNLENQAILFSVSGGG